MTKEELEKEAEEKCAKYKLVEMKTYEVEAYVEGAEPREKRIAELEQENKKLQHGCEGATMMYNALKEARNLIENIIRVTWGEGWNYSLDWKVKAEAFLNKETEDVKNTKKDN